MTQKDIDSSIAFVAARFKAGAFSADRTWRRLGIASGAARWRRWRAAAAAAAVVVIAATATVVYTLSEPEPRVSAQSETPAPAETGRMTAVHAVDFDNAPLTEVVEGIRTAYGVEVDGVPGNAAELRLTLHFEGNAEDLVYAVNDILGTSMTVQQ